MRLWSLALLLVPAAVSAQSKSNTACHTDCSASSFPHCGTWLEKETLSGASGVYRLGEGRLNLTCSATSLPRPVHLSWLFQAHGGGEWKHLHCSSLKEVQDCGFNAAGEHRTTSTCVLRLAGLNQTGAYKCVSKGSHPLSSPAAKVQVYGISVLKAVSEGRRLRLGSSGEVGVVVCSNPEPGVVWLNAASGKALASDPAYHPLPLEPLISAPNASHKPAQPIPFCYQSRLVISRVTKEDASIEAVASTPTHSRTHFLRPQLRGSSSTAPASPLPSLLGLIFVFGLLLLRLV